MLQREKKMPELAPCPFCGGEALYLTNATPLAMRVVASCSDCGVSSDTSKTHRGAAKKWNRRPPKQKLASAGTMVD